MKQLIKINTDNKGKQVVSAMELYTNLGYDKTHYNRWIKKNITDNPFGIENEDWCKLAIKATLVGRGNYQDFALSIDFAKRLAMMARTEQGEKVRRYFINCETNLIRLKEAGHIRHPGFPY